VVRSSVLAIAVALVGVCVLWGRHLNDVHAHLALDAPPFVGQWSNQLSRLALLPVAVALLIIALGPLVAAMMRWRGLLVLTVLASAAWAVSLALTMGVDGLRKPLKSPDEYLGEVHRVHDVTGFLSTFTSYINTYGGPGHWLTHVAGHPPGLLLFLAGMSHVGLGGVWPAVVLCVGGGCLASAAALVTVREVVDEATARAVAPFVVVMPAALWIAVSPDALFLGVTAWGIALLAIGAHRHSDRWSLAGGLLLGCSLMLTYGVLTIGAVALGVMVVHRRLRPLVFAALGVVVVIGTFAALGFWWFDGLHETLIRYRAGAGGSRPYRYFVLADLVVLAVAVGPAAVAGLTSITRRDRLWWIVGPVLLAVLAADLSGDSKAEVERIWLPFTPWLVLGAARMSRPRLWLGLQAAVAIGLQSFLVSKW
jgi:hypothetical protein